MTLENAMRNARTKNPAAFDAALRSLGILPPAKGTKRFAEALRSRFKRPEDALKALGMDSMSVSELVGREKTKTAGDDLEDISFDAEKVRSFCKDCGLTDDTINELFEMLPRRQHVEGELSERTSRDSEQQERQRRLETSEHEYAAQHEHDNRSAAEREHRGSLQSEDNLNANRIRGGKGGRWAHDENFLRVGTSMSTSLLRQLEAGNAKRDPKPTPLASDARLRKLDEKFGISRIGGNL
jgi:hypothetical protein